MTINILNITNDDKQFRYYQYLNSLNINNDDKQFKTSSYAFIIMQIFLCIYKITIDDPFA